MYILQDAAFLKLSAILISKFVLLKTLDVLRKKRFLSDNTPIDVKSGV